MKTVISLLAIGALILAAYILLKPDTQPQPLTSGLPWQIERLDDGYTRVFNIVPGKTLLSEVVALVSEDHDVAIISDQNDQAALELYDSQFKAGPLAAKLIVRFDTDSELLVTMQEQAARSEYMPTGARKFFLSDEHLVLAQQFTVLSITLVPSAKLDDDIVRSRFGNPSRQISNDSGITHYLYPELGLEVVLNDKGKSRLQYVAPQQFDLITAPLEPVEKPTPLPVSSSAP